MTGFETATMAARAVGDCIVFVHGSDPPSDAEWDRAMTLYGSLVPRNATVFVWTEGAAPNAAQRAKLAKVTGTAKPPIAVVTTSPIARAAGTAISWFNSALRMFSPSDVTGALDHLGIAADRRPALLAVLGEMRATVLRVTPRDRA